MWDRRCKCVSIVGIESGEWMSPSEEFLLQEFVFVICTMSPFPLVPLCARADWRSVLRLILHVEKCFSFFLFFPLKCLYNLLFY